MQTQQTLRQHLRQQRQQLNHAQRQQFAMAIARQLTNFTPLKAANHIGAYAAAKGEADCQPAMKTWLKQGKQVYLPRMRKGNRMRFHPWRSERGLYTNQFGIAEPTRKQHIPIKSLDILLVPLVAFNRQGQRMGMGGGYYDRALAFKNHQPWHKKPLLVGIAYSFQEAHLPKAEPWDVYLDWIITEKEVINAASAR